MLQLANFYLRKLYGQIRMISPIMSSDAIFSSYPKSGRTWFRHILARYFLEAAAVHRDLDLHSLFEVVPNMAWDRKRGIPAFRYRSEGVPLILVTHEAYSPLRFVGRPIIFMVRDPRDVIVSAYFHASRHKHRYSGDVAEFVRNPVQGLDHLIDYLNDWGDILKSYPDRHMFSYEQLSANPDATVADVLRFLHRPVDMTLVRRAVQASTFSKMREVEMARGIPDHIYDRSDPDALRARRGEVGGFVDYLDQATIDWIDERCRERLNPAACKMLATTRAYDIMDMDERPTPARAGRVRATV